MLKTNSLGLCQRLNMEKVLAENRKTTMQGVKEAD